ncbi:Zn-dependent hydrolase [Bacillus coahuilensis m2-6]|uniref:ribonuclease J n=1 Tax=Bacillus coahuilensis TaxID=408580 RepID=UPI000750510C|nr:ribonuclease J [Bacillus coahuilensis]KUP08716.1 Zn-dependent hydrolase [Bacillus coahuilensis m2-6]
MSKRKNDSIRIIPLGGVGEIGKNMYVVEVDEDLFVIDSGLKFPENDMLGIDVVIPDFTFLENNKERVRGIFLTHGHEDAIGALPYLLRNIKAPVYGTKLTLALAKARIKELNQKVEGKFFTIHSNSRLSFNSVNVTFFKTTHSIPDSVGIAIHTSEGAIVHTGEFKFDQSATGFYRPDIGKMAQLGEKGVLCLLSDSTEAERPGFTTSESVISRQLSDAFHSAKERIIVSCFSANLIRIQQVFDAAKETNRKVAVVGKSLEKVYEVALKLGYLEVDETSIIPVSEAKELHPSEVVILATGNQGEPLEALQKMASGTHKLISIEEGDTVFIAVSPSPSIELMLFKTVDAVARAGANVLTSSKKVHVSGHGSQEDLKMMINLIKPKYFVPIQGEFRMLKSHATLASSLGIEHNHIFLLEKGDVLEYSDERMKVNGRVPTGNVLIDGLGVGDIGNIVLRDRRLLSQDGILIVVITLTKQNRMIVSGPEIISRGFVYVRESEKLMAESADLVREIVNQNLQQQSVEWATIKQDVRDKLNYFLYNKTKRRPMILPIIMEV